MVDIFPKYRNKNSSGNSRDKNKNYKDELE